MFKLSDLKNLFCGVIVFIDFTYIEFFCSGKNLKGISTLNSSINFRTDKSLIFNPEIFGSNDISTLQIQLESV